MTFSELEAHVATFIVKEKITAKSTLHQLLNMFVDHVEAEVSRVKLDSVRIADEVRTDIAAEIAPTPEAPK